MPPIAKAMPSGIGAPRSSLPDVASFAREEILRLIQHLFLAAENVNGTRRRQVVFCGIDNNDGSNLLCARIGRNLAEQVQSRFALWTQTFGSPHPARWSICFRLMTRQIRRWRYQRGASRRVTENLWLASGDSACRMDQSGLGRCQAWISEPSVPSLRM